MKNYKNSFLPLFLVAIFVTVFLSFTSNLGKEPWTEKQLMQPADLVKIINAGNKPTTYVYSVGPAALIKNSIDIGQCREQDNLEKLKVAVIKLPKDAPIVLYCGCCPFANCPNIRPSFSLLNEKGFTNHKLLNLPKSLKADWIDKGYPLNE